MPSFHCVFCISYTVKERKSFVLLIIVFIITTTKQPDQPDPSYKSMNSLRLLPPAATQQLPVPHLVEVNNTIQFAFINNSVQQLIRINKATSDYKMEHFSPTIRCEQACRAGGD